MDFNELSKRIERQRRELEQYVARKFPVKAGAAVKSIVQENFRKGGFQNGARFTKWAVTKRQFTGKGADAKRGPLLSSRKILYGGTGYRTGTASVTIYNNVIYAGIHNEGGTLHPTITPKMRKYAWARYYEAMGGGKKGKKAAATSPEAERWKGLALTKKRTLNITIPKRQFIGPSETINSRLQTMIETDLTTILTK